MTISMSAPDLTEPEIRAVLGVLSTPQLSIGPQIEAFERAFAAYAGTRHAIGVSSGTSGLHLAVIASGIGEGDLVITTPFSFVASANCVLYQRGIPIFVDVDPVTGNINPGLAAEAAKDLTQGGSAAQRWLPPSFRDQQSKIGELKVILPVHVFGQPADMDSLQFVAGEHGLAVIEDACEAVGAEFKGRRVGALGDVGIYAFYPNKQMTTGEGGVMVTNRPDWDVLFRSLRNQGRDVFDAWLNHSRLGYNYRLDEMSAALGLAQLGRIDELLAKRARVAGWYTERVRDLDLVEAPTVISTTTRMSWFVYVVRLKPPARRGEIMKRLEESDIPSRPYFSPVHLQPFYRERFGYRGGEFPITEDLGERSLALPFHNHLTEDEVSYVVEALKTALAHAG